MGCLAAPIVLVRVVFATARLTVALGGRYPKAALVVLAALFVATGGRW